MDRPALEIFEVGLILGENFENFKTLGGLGQPIDLEQVYVNLMQWIILLVRSTGTRLITDLNAVLKIVVILVTLLSHLLLPLKLLLYLAGLVGVRVFGKKVALKVGRIGLEQSL